MRSFLASSTPRIALALLVGVITVPAATTAVLLRTEALQQDATLINLQQKAISDRVTLRRQRRQYWQAIEEYQNKLRNGEEAVKPDINDISSYGGEAINTFVPKPAAPVVRKAATNTGSSLDSVTTKQLTTQDRALLRSYTRAKMCPESLKRFPIPGFYDLCLTLVGGAIKDEPTIGLLNHKAYTRRSLGVSVQRPSIKLRLQMMEEALDRSNRRTSENRHPRPTPYKGVGITGN